jgi:CIC family chloride channel protein
MAVLTGVITGYGSLAFHHLIGFLENLFLYNRIDFHLVSSLHHTRGAWIILIPAVAIAVVAFIIEKFATEARGHGVPEVIEAVIRKKGLIRKRVSFVKALASSLTIGAGGSVGQEGPIVQIGSAAGSSLGQVFRLRPNLIKTLVGCGAAGGIAATFNTPIAGVIFAVELIILELKTKSFIPLVISSVFATVISRHYLGNEPVLSVPHFTLNHPVELIFYLGLGLLSAIVGVMTIKTLYKTEDFFENLPIHFIWKALGGGLLLGLLAYFFPEILGVGYETVQNALRQEATFPMMFGLIFLKIIAMSLTIAAGGSGGVFAPCFYIGAMLGGAYGFAVQGLFPDFVEGYGAYALVGMASVFAASSRATFTSIVILFEMTLDYSIILPLMFACVIADETAHAILKESIYSLKLKRRGLSFNTDLAVDILAITPIKQIMSTDLEVLRNDMTLKEAEEVIKQNSHAIYPVVDRQGVLYGICRTASLRAKMKELESEAKISDVIKVAPIVVYPDETAQNAIKKIGKARDPRILVVSPNEKKLLGIVAPRDLIRLNNSKDS